MSVILEFSIDAGDFELGQVLRGPPPMHIELERVVPTGDLVMPFVWATGNDHEAFEEAVRSDSRVRELLVLDSVGESHLYRIEWDSSSTALIETIATTGATVLEARGDDEWLFRLRFPDHDALSKFHQIITDRDIPIYVERTFTLTGDTGHGYRFDLTEEQREALILALNRGYFETPSDVTLDDLASELGISRQALSHRIRLGNEKILRSTLLTTKAPVE
ncbi:helix-turn-helix domain-containing protein [Haloferax sp. DFSO52]|uniref:helix-turn-helix domain-containing protein n=1 Tax=Haloferax sp. DFSO52 TaxID=3388505 RepID=UPI003A847D23